MGSQQCQDCLRLTNPFLPLPMWAPGLTGGTVPGWRLRLPQPVRTVVVPQSHSSYYSRIMTIPGVVPGYGPPGNQGQGKGLLPFGHS